ncbi:hypothetical protein EV2_015430 [Malus domestica]
MGMRHGGVVRGGEGCSCVARDNESRREKLADMMRPSQLLRFMASDLTALVVETGLRSFTMVNVDFIFG